jgi:hypothetical protein
MHLKTALRIAIPFAVEDREAMVAAYGGEGPEADESRALGKSFRDLIGLRPAAFTEEQKETARLALCYAEQHLDGYIAALNGFDKKEVAMARKQRQQICRVRREHFGKTWIEDACKGAVAVDVMEYANRITKGGQHGAE